MDITVQAILIGCESFKWLNKLSLKFSQESSYGEKIKNGKSKVIMTLIAPKQNHPSNYITMHLSFLYGSNIVNILLGQKWLEIKLDRFSNYWSLIFSFFSYSGFDKI